MYARSILKRCKILLMYLVHSHYMRENLVELQENNTDDMTVEEIAYELMELTVDNLKKFCLFLTFLKEAEVVERLALPIAA